MSKTSITLSKPVPASAVEGAPEFKELVLQDMEAGHYFDGAREAPENASRAELEARVAAKCAGVDFSVIRRLSMPDYKKISDWYDSQWVVKGGGGDPLPGGAKPTS